MPLTTDSEAEERAPEEMATLDPVMDEAIAEVTPEGAATEGMGHDISIISPALCPDSSDQDGNSLPAQRADCKLTAAAWSSAEQVEAIQAEAAATARKHTGGLAPHSVLVFQ